MTSGLTTPSEISKDDTGSESQPLQINNWLRMHSSKPIGYGEDTEQVRFFTRWPRKSNLRGWFPDLCLQDVYSGHIRTLKWQPFQYSQGIDGFIRQRTLISLKSIENELIHIHLAVEMAPALFLGYRIVPMATALCLVVSQALEQTDNVDLQRANATRRALTLQNSRRLSTRVSGLAWAPQLYPKLFIRYKFSSTCRRISTNWIRRKDLGTFNSSNPGHFHRISRDVLRSIAPSLFQRLSSDKLHLNWIKF